MQFLKKFWPWALVLLAGVLAARSMLFTPGRYYNMHDDLQMMRQMQMEKCFVDGQIPCRWVPDMGFGFGFPLFNFYPPLPYLIGQVIRLFGFSYVATAKTLFALSLIAAGVGMYLLAKEFFGKIGGILSAVFYIWAPYHAVDVFVRGAMNEAWGLVWFPLIFWAGYKLVTNEKKKVVGNATILALAWFALLTSHNLMVLILAPVFGVWVLIWLWQGGQWQRIKALLGSGVLALGLAAFFTLPAILENSLTQISGQLVGYYDYTAHFVNLNQLFVSRFWGDGPSVWGAEDDGMSFQVGHIHWIGSIVIFLFTVRLLMRGKSKSLINKLKSNPPLMATIFLLLVSWFSLFMTHTRSTPLWGLVSQLGYLQFPWRFLTLGIFGISFSFGATALLIKNIRIKLLVLGILGVGLIAFNWGYFKPVWMGPLKDEDKFTGIAWVFQQTAGIFDYLPKTAITAPKDAKKTLGEIMQGDAVVENEEQGTDWAQFDINVATGSAVVRLGILAFPNWRVYVDGVEAPNYLAEDEMWGRMYVDVPQGQHSVRAELHDTPVRTASNYISLLSWIGLISFPLWRSRIKINR